MEQVAVKAWGNSQGIRISKNVLDQLNIHISDVLDLEIKEDAIVLKKSFKHKSFDERLLEYNGEISVCNFDWGEPIGKEML